MGSPTLMEAVVLREHGPPEVLALGQAPDPKPRTGEVVVELRTAAINRRDTALRKGAVGGFGLPYVLGSDGAGVRRDTGEEVVILPSLGWGDREDAPADGFRILGGPDDGTYAELIRVPAENLYPKPRRFTFVEAAAFPLAGLTAYRALFTRARLEPGETVLMLGAGSGVSTFAVLLAAQRGARVIVTSSSDDKLEASRQLGAEAGVNYTAGDWVEEVRALTGGLGVDVVVDSVGATWPDSVRCARRGGRVVAFGATAGATVELEVRPMYFGQISLLGTTMGSPREFAELLAMIDAGMWTPVIDSVRPLADVAQAHARMEAGEHFGKLVLKVA
jgi:NADPH:quinone reductase-like Zn-dependent oxidoreductase